MSVMLTFREYVAESSLRTVGAIGIGLKLRSLHQQVVQDRTASKADKILSQELVWLAALVGLGFVTGNKDK
jgi:hypothetical protein